MTTFHCLIKTFEDLSPHEQYQIHHLRQKVFIVEQNCPYLDADGKDLISLHVLLHDRENILQAYCRIVPLVEKNAVSIGRIVSSSDSRGLGLGKQVVQEALQEIHKHYGPIPIEISAQCYLIKFYESFGFCAEGQEYLEDGLPHIFMRRPKGAPEDKMSAKQTSNL